MSNLKLPTMTIANLRKVRPNGGRIGYKTEIMWNNDRTKVGIYHHAWEEMAEHIKKEMYENEYETLVELCIATEEEISLVTTINGENLETYESILFARTGYRNFGQLEDD